MFTCSQTILLSTFIYRGVLYFWWKILLHQRSPDLVTSPDPPPSPQQALLTVYCVGAVHLLDSLSVCAGRVCGWAIWIGSSGSHSEQMCTSLVCIPHAISGNSVLIPVSPGYATVDGTVAKPQCESLQMKPANSILWLTGWKKICSLTIVCKVASGQYE